MRPLRRAFVFGWLLALPASAAAQIPADGWSGQVQCVVAVRGVGYEEDQTHTWVITGPPIVRNDFRDYPATWSVTGRGRRTSVLLRGAAPGAADSWTESGTANGTITIYVPVNTNTLRVSPGQTPLKAARGLQGIGAGGPISVDVDEWRFMYIDIAGGATQPSATGTRPAPRGTGRAGWRAPADASLNETCTWTLNKGAGSTSVNPRRQGPGIAVSPTTPAATSVLLPPGTVVTTPSATILPPSAGTVLPDLAASLVGSDSTGAAVASWPANSQARYVAEVKNLGAGSANGASIWVPAVAGLTMTSVTCTASGGAVCPANVSVQDIIGFGMPVATFPSGAAVQLTIAANVAGSVGSQASMTVSAEARVTEANNANNSVTRTHSIVAPSSSSSSGAQQFVSSGTFTVPSNVTRVIVEAWGAGGGGRNGQSNTCDTQTSCSSASGGPGGGGGAYARVQLDVTAGSALVITIGAGGFAGQDGAITQVRRGGAVIASASGGKGNGTGASDWQGETGQPGRPGAYGSSGQHPDESTYLGGAGGRGGDAVTGSITPIVSGGAGGAGVSYHCGPFNFGIRNCTKQAGAEPVPGSAGFVLISW